MIENLTYFDTCDYARAITELSEYILLNPMDDNAYYMRGNVYRKMEMFGDALNDYSKAVALNPQSPAVITIEILNEILAYRNTDLLNP